ncbi:MAG: hypothetical protein KGL39_51700 [Patescibacteria group bacterium]|nr:hypothetical protein [Patescibacteria group bacterium]
MNCAKITIKILAAVILMAAAGRPSFAEQWFLNGKIGSSPYVINQYDPDGLPHSDAPVAMPPSGSTNVAWPSALIPFGGSKIFLYASTYGALWNAVHLWTATSVDGPFIDQGSVFSADPVLEPYGIGPAQVTYEPTSILQPFIMYYLVRGASGPGQTIAVATSVDGVHWTRGGPVLSTSLPQEAGGLSASYACKTASGDYALFYHGYSSDLSAGYGLVATSNSATGPFSNKAVILAPQSFLTTLTSYAGSVTARVPSGVSVPIGIPLLAGYSTSGQEPVVAVRQSGTLVWFSRPFLYPHSSDQTISMLSAKVDPSYAQEQADGTWKGTATAYGPAPGVAAEYTTGVAGSSLSGPWTFAANGIAFTPFTSYGLNSTENPTPLVSDNKCSN